MRPDLSHMQEAVPVEKFSIIRVEQDRTRALPRLLPSMGLFPSIPRSPLSFSSATRYMCLLLVPGFHE